VSSHQPARHKIASESTQAGHQAGFNKRRTLTKDKAGLQNRLVHSNKQSLSDMTKPLLQPKLRIGQPNDKYEEEADRVADMVMRMPEPNVQRQTEEEEELQAKALSGPGALLIQRQIDEEEEEIQPEASSENALSWIQRQVEEEEEEEEIQTKAETVRSPQIIPTPFGGRKVGLGKGSPLPKPPRSFFESRFGYDFTQVRIHTDARATDSANALNAKAFTLGHNIVFRQGQYDPQTTVGKKLIAHELTHVIQQARRFSDQSNFKVTHHSDPSEKEAEKRATHVPNTTYIQTISPHSIAVQREIQGDFDLTQAASPLLARAIGSVTIDGFETGKADISTDNEKKLKEAAAYIVKLLNRYPGSTVHVIGHTDAVDSPKYNMQLGRERAGSVKTALKGMGVPADSIQTGSKGESELLVKTQKAEPQNRRVEVRFEPFVSPIGEPFPELRLTPPKPISPEPEGEKRHIELLPPSIHAYPPLLKEPPPAAARDPRNWLEEGLKRDPLIRKLPDWAREKVIDALKDADEKAAEKIIDALPLDAKEKAALKAAVKSILQLLKGKRFEMPVPPLHEPPPPPFEGFPKMPGEKIFTLPPIRF
jgi:outer membrane protein OmpA-like peptidoglycan-associated protein